MQRYTDTIDVGAQLNVGIWNHQTLLGDRLAMTSFVRDLKETYPHWNIYVDVAKDDVWRHNPHIAGVVTPGTPAPEKLDIAWRIGPFAATQGSKTNGIHFMRAFAYGWTRKTGLPVRQGPLQADIHLTPQELAYRPIAGDYWVVNPDTNNMGAKRWDPDRWRQLFRSLPQLHFVQVGLGSHAAIDYGDEPNVTSLLDQTTERQLFALVAHSTGCISLISSLMHIAAAFDKPCVVLAGGREPQSFEQYPGHQFIHRIGAMPCASRLACWKNSIGACKDQRDTPHGPVAACMLKITPQEVARAIEVYYDGGRLQKPESASIAVNPQSAIRHPKVLKIVTNGKCYGGAERSCRMIAAMAAGRGWQVQLATRQAICPEMRDAFANVAVVTDRVSDPCDVLLWYASDQVFDAHLDEFGPLRQASANAGRRVMALTYKLGKVPELDWCRDWDRYLFLSSEMRDAFIGKTLGQNTVGVQAGQCEVLAPPVDLTAFLGRKPTYDGHVRVVRHSSQGDKKWPMSTQQMVVQCCDALFAFMPGPSWLDSNDRVVCHRPHAMAVPELLEIGNLFVYLLPDGYTDQGPRVIVEAMAAGLAVIADKRCGAKDRVTPETGWLVDDHAEAIAIINAVTPELLEAKGRAARERARTEFDPQRWLTAILGDENGSER